MNKADKVAHLRALADALEEGRDIVFDGGYVYRNKDGEYDLNACIWDYKPKPKPFECWVTLFTDGSIGQGHSKKTRVENARSVRMREVE